ncbi:MAG: hypothetical protein HQL33_08915 [Alphaproteobacteria bacterium]|nr:hypothetical protein [Alphaproteobacteria bacterium]MBF0130102.1 hypothetical protein [Alphaproteobacteria bacterium]
MAVKKAGNVQGGRFVRTLVDGRECVCLKAIGHGKDYTNHYVVPLDPPADGDLKMLYVDYSVEVEDCNGAYSLALDPVDAPPEVGHVLVTGKGSFIKVHESNKGAWSLGYVDIKSGAVRRRQERDITGVFRWRLVPHHPEGVLGKLRSLLG